MADFGPAEFVHSEKGKKNMLKVKSRLGDQEHFYLFRYKDAHGLCTRYKCYQCEKLKKQNHGVGSIRCMTVKDGVVQSDPDVNHNPHCHPLPIEELLSVQVEREMCRDVRGGMRHSEAHKKGLKSLGKRCREEEADYEAVSLQVRPHHKLAIRFRKNQRQGLPAVPDWRHLPQQYQVSLRGRNDEYGVDQHRGEQWLQLIHENPNILLFMTVKEMNVLIRALTIICDGTFDKCPKEFKGGQIYTIHADVNGESVPIVLAIMQQKTIAAYTILFTAIRDRTLAAHPGQQLQLQKILMDYEHPAIVAAEAVFGVPVRGCLFHFPQCIDRQVKRYHLQAEYALKHEIYNWIRNLIALSMVPNEHVEPVFDNILDLFPETLVHPFNHRCRQLADYFREQWMNGREPIERWNHFENMGDRTTNKAEGWHNKLNEVIGRSHLRLDRFLEALQDEHHRQLTRIDQLESGQPPKPRNPIYVQLNNRIFRYRDELREWLRLNQNAPNRMKEEHIIGYMRAMQYLLAGQTPPDE